MWIATVPRRPVRFADVRNRSGARWQGHAPDSSAECTGIPSRRRPLDQIAGTGAENMCAKGYGRFSLSAISC